MDICAFMCNYSSIVDKMSHEEICLDEGMGGGAFDVYQLLQFMECVCRIENFKR